MSPTPAGHPITIRGAISLGLAAAVMTLALPLHAQTDYYNTDRGRPVQVEDAYVTERYAFELKLAPLRLELPRGGGSSFGLEPEFAFGVLPRTQLEIGLPLLSSETAGDRRTGIAGLELSLMHNLNAETLHWPALAIRADVLAPVGTFARDRPATSVTGLATRTFGWGRAHLNTRYTFGSAGFSTALPAASGGSGAALDASRWFTGLAVDKTLPLRSTLLTAELYGRMPLQAGQSVEYTVGAGTRYQVSPNLAVDAGGGRHLNGDAEGWYVTFGTAYALRLRRFFPGGSWGAQAP